ncbi:MAG: amino acid ABC transporter permease [Ruminococcus sp.]|nr:amino acid ABC transporter permease [Ruminococcus sp.]
MGSASFLSVTLNLLHGFYTTFLIFAITLVVAIPLGLIITFGSASKIKPISVVVRCFVWIIRGTPLLLQILVLVYGPGLVFGHAFYENSVGVMIAFIINYACYFSEIYRGGIESISRGQYEAGHVLGMTKSQVFFKVVLLQVVKHIIPPMGNEIITLVKDTSLVRIVGALMFMGSQYKEILGKSFEYVSVNALIWPLFYSGAFYLIFCGLLTLLFGYLEKKLDYYKS